MYAEWASIAETASYVAVVFSLPLAVLTLWQQRRDSAENGKKERLEAAEKIYQTVDQRYMDFVKLSLEHPRLDCYSLPLETCPSPPLSDAEKCQQKMLFTALTNIFEVAFVHYHREESNPVITRMFRNQWTGWETYMRKFFQRPAYRETREEIKDEFDEQFVSYTQKNIVPQTVKASAGLSG